MDGQYGFSGNTQNNGMNYNMGGQMPNANGNAQDYMLWLILSIIQICSLCCCNCIGFIFGIISLIFVITANNAYKAGNINLYASKIKTAKIINIIGWVGMILSFIIGMVMGIFNNMANSLSNIR